MSGTHEKDLSEGHEKETSISRSSRRKQFREFVRRHPSTPEQWVRTEFYKSEKGAGRAATTLSQKQTDGIRYVGGIQLKGTGRKKNVYFNGPQIIQNLLHEWWVTEVVLPAWKWTRRFGQVDKFLTPDAQIVVYPETPINVEIDLDSEGYDQAKAQFDKYRETGEVNVWFAPTEARLEGLMRFATPQSMFFLLEERGWYEVWRNALADM